MNRSFTNQLLSILLAILLMVSCQSHQENEDIIEINAPSQLENTSSEEEEIKAVLDKILIAVGNRDVQELGDLTFDQALIGWTFLKDGVWLNKKLTIEEYLNNIAQTEHPTPISETAIDYDISVTQGRLATVELPTVISKFGIATSEEVNHAIMMKEKDQWKLFSIAWTVHRIPDEEKVFDLNLFAKGYAQVWGSNKPEFVAMFFEEDGTLQVNDDEPARGRSAISNVAQSFMSKFPDMIVHFDSLSFNNEEIKFYWTLTGTDADPSGNGHEVKVSGFEHWTMSENNLIKDSKGSFPSEEYMRQLEFGIEN